MRIRILFAPKLLLLLIAVTVHGQDQERISLSKLPGFYVEIVIQGGDSDSLRAGVTEEQVRTDTELKLRRAGIRVLTEKEMTASPANPILIVYVQLHRPTEQALAGMYAFSLSVGVSQYVQLQSSLSVLAKTWSKDSLGITGKNKIRKLRKFTEDLIDQFVNDFLAANPKL